jgi:hypothetical protein
MSLTSYRAAPPRANMRPFTRDTNTSDKAEVNGPNGRNKGMGSRRETILTAHRLQCLATTYSSST